MQKSLFSDPFYSKIVSFKLAEAVAFSCVLVTLNHSPEKCGRKRSHRLSFSPFWHPFREMKYVGFSVQWVT